MRWPAFTWPRGLREAGLALAAALAVLLPLTLFAPGVVRELETASLDLRFRLRGALPPELSAVREQIGNPPRLEARTAEGTA